MKELTEQFVPSHARAPLKFAERLFATSARSWRRLLALVTLFSSFTLPGSAIADSAVGRLYTNVQPVFDKEYSELPMDKSFERFQDGLQGQFIGKGSILADGWTVRIQSRAEHVDDGFVGNLNLVQSKATIHITDEFTLTWTGPLPAPPFPAKLLISGELDVDVLVDDFQESTFHLGAAIIDGNIIDLDVVQNGTLNLIQPFEVVIPVAAGAGSISYSLSSDSYARNAGSETLSSLTMADIQLGITSFRADIWDIGRFDLIDPASNFTIVGLGSVHLLPIEGTSDSFTAPLPSDFTMASTSGTTAYATDMDGNLILGVPRGFAEGAIFTELFPGFAPADVLDDPEEFFSDPTVRSVLATPLPPMASGAQSLMDLVQFDEAGIAHNFGEGRIDALRELPTPAEVGWLLEFESGRPLPDAPISIPGDFNQDRVVDAADYVVWSKSNGQSGDDLVADGNGDEVVDELDYDVWRSNFAATAPPTPSSSAALVHIVPEPSARILALLGAMFFRVRNQMRGCRRD